MSSAFEDRSHDERGREFGDVVRPVMDTAERRQRQAVTAAINAWGQAEAGALPLEWRLTPLDAWEPQRGSRWVGQATSDYDEAEVAGVLETWAKFLRLESRGDRDGDGSLTFESPRDSGFRVEIWGVIDRERWEEKEW